jgi:AP-1-like factor
LKADVLPGMYDAFCFGHVIPTTYNPPDPEVAVTSMQVGSVSCETGGDVEDSQTSRTRSSNKEREEVIMHAQSRRKAQNRVSYVVPSLCAGGNTSKLTVPFRQRAFRERKERHMRDLEAELLVLKSSTYSLLSDNKRLKLALQRSWNENGNLRAIAGQSPTPLRRFSADSVPGYASVQSG